VKKNMVMKNNLKKWLMMISIISAVLMITPSFGVVKASETIQSTPQSDDPGLEEYLKLLISGIENGGSNSDENSNPSDSNEMVGEATNSEQTVDVEISADSSGIVNWPVEIQAVPLNIIGYAEVNVIDGGENLVRTPVFGGLDLIDNLALTITALSVILVARIAQILKQNIGLMTWDLATTIGKLVVVGMLAAFIASVAASSLPLFLIFFSGVATGTLFSILDGNGVPESLKNLIKSICEPIKQMFAELFDKIQAFFEDFDWQLALDSIKNLINSIPAILKFIAQKSLAAVAGLIKVFTYVIVDPNWSEIASILVSLGLSSSDAQQLVSLIQGSYSLIRSIRDNIFGKRDIFLTYGANVRALRDLHVEIGSDYQLTGDGYVAKLEIKLISAGNEFDVKTIGVHFDGFESGDLELVAQQQTVSSSPASMPSSTTTMTESTYETTYSSYSTTTMAKGTYGNVGI
jgi:hypothetical protein